MSELDRQIAEHDKWDAQVSRHLYQEGDQHQVMLPHPSRTGVKTIGTCVCGWTVSYGWGGHNDATTAAGKHIKKAGLATPVQMQRMDGLIRVMEGVSL